MCFKQDSAVTLRCRGSCWGDQVGTRQIISLGTTFYCHSPLPCLSARDKGHWWTAPHPFQDEAHVNDVRLSETSLQGADWQRCKKEQDLILGYHPRGDQKTDSSHAWQILHLIERNPRSMFWRPSVSLSEDLPESQVTNYFSLYLSRFLPALLG